MILRKGRPRAGCGSDHATRGNLTRQAGVDCGAAAAAFQSPIESSATPMDLIRIILAILLPPLGVFLQVGFGGHFWLNILLTLLGYIPGIVHAVWIIARR